MIRVISHAQWFGLDEKQRQRGGTPAIIEVIFPNGPSVRFFSFSAKDQDDAEHINNAANILKLSAVDF